jgi:HK97 gp10 family phage protein
MADRVLLTLEGTKELKRALLAMDAVSTETVLRPIVAEGAETLRGVAEQLAPVLKRPHKGRIAGALRRGIEVAFLKAGTGYCHFVVKLKPETWYGWLQEFGLGGGRASGAVLTPKTRKAHERYQRRREAMLTAGTPMKGHYGQLHNMAAQPWLRPAVKFARDSIITRMLERIAAVIVRAGGGG